MRLDHFDAKIVNLVQKDARLTGDQLSPLVGLSAAACSRRFKRLRDEGLIEAEIAVVSPKAAGYDYTLKLLLSFKRDYAADAVDRFKQTVRNAREVVSADLVTGDTDFIMTIVTRSMAEYEALLRRWHREHPCLDGSRTLVVMDPVKAGLAITVEPSV